MVVRYPHSTHSHISAIYVEAAVVENGVMLTTQCNTLKIVHCTLYLQVKPVHAGQCCNRNQ